MLVAHLRGFTPNTSIDVVTTQRTQLGNILPVGTQSVTTDLCGNADHELLSIFNGSGSSMKIDADGYSSGFVFVTC